MHIASNVRITFSLGVISGDNKRWLEDYVDSSLFVQRKDYDEYTVIRGYTAAKLDLYDFKNISEYFKVTINSDSIDISEKE